MAPVILVLVAFLLHGCASYGDESIRDYGSDWPPLTMTKAQLIGTLGSPRMRTISSDGGITRETLTWSYGEAQASPSLMIPVVGLFVAASGNGVTGDTRALNAVFGTDGKMISRTWVHGRIGNASSDDPPVVDLPVGRTSAATQNGRDDPSAAGSQ